VAPDQARPRAGEEPPAPLCRQEIGSGTESSAADVRRHPERSGIGSHERRACRLHWRRCRGHVRPRPPAITHPPIPIHQRSRRARSKLIHHPHVTLHARGSPRHLRDCQRADSPTYRFRATSQGAQAHAQRRAAVRVRRSGLLDIGASCSMFSSKSYFGTDYRSLPNPMIRAHPCCGVRIGTASPLILNSIYGKHIIADIPNSLHEPDLERPLINFPGMHDTGAITLRPDHYLVQLPEHTIVMHRQRSETTLPIHIRPAAARHPRTPARTNHLECTSQTSPFQAHNPHPRLPSALDTPLASMSDAHDHGALRILAAARAGQPGASQHKALIRAAASNGYIPKAIPNSSRQAFRRARTSLCTRAHHRHHTSGPHLAAPDPLTERWEACPILPRHHR
jgi:hypothetical protein